MKNVHRHRRNGKVYKYHRHTKVRLPDLPESHPDFIAAWLEEERAMPRVDDAGTLGHEIALFFRSAMYRDLSPDYARVIDRHLKDIRTRRGDSLIKHIKTQHIEMDLEPLEPHAANARRKAWRLLYKAMSRKGVADVSGAVKARQTPRTEGHLPVTLDQFAAYRDRWAIGTPQRLAGELLFWTGARTVDAVRLSLSHVGSDGLLTYRQSKTSNPAHVPWTSHLPHWAPWDEDRAMLMRCIGTGFTFLETSYGRARTKKGLSNLISQSFAEIGIDRSAHGFRKTRLTLIAEAGGSTQAIMSWGGHVTLAEAEDYTRSAERRRVLVGIR